MEYVIILIILLASSLAAVWIIKKQISFGIRTVFNVLFLLSVGLCVVMTGIQPTSFLIYVILFFSPY